MDKECPPSGKCDVRDDVLALKTEFADFRRQNTKTHENFGERLGDLEAENKIRKVEVSNVQKDVASIGDDLKEIKAEAKDMSRQFPVIAEQVKSIHENSKAMDADVDELREKPGKRWESVVGQIIGLVVAALVGLLLARMGLNG